ncbi:glycoside hydrolase family 42 [Pseudoalteromonas haloplanktis]|uniref:Glycoside hydrolase family 42 n=1 Tax=Pseudoalteromonas haloplanktis TaxID=228 RepID=A0ABU1B988_PSEHA|nr:glycoside hydrolase family 42 [Pseudoalteromonas haloplanktis]MDQ9090361.1 glycoside hydrolase family 42 [Pseudoalteromonas haloplanktis]
MRKKISYAIWASLLPFCLASCEDTTNSFQQEAKSTESTHPAPLASENALVISAQQKMAVLETKMAQAEAQNIDVTREETVMWFAKEFLKFADWDEKNEAAVEKAFSYYAPYRDKSKELAKELPDFERSKVNDILDAGISELDLVLNGGIKRRPVNKVDWQNIEVAENMLKSNSKPIFLYDYFSKTVGQPLTNKAVYNDHLGAIYHGGENLYPVDHDRAINSFLLKEDGSYDQALLDEVTQIDGSNVGFLIYWNMGVPQWIEKREPEVRKGRSLFTGYDIDNPLIRDTWGKIARDTGELTRGKKVTQLGYILANEPHWFSESDHWSHQFKEMNDISSYTLNNFRDWLKDKYAGEIAALNNNWQSDFSSFETVQIIIPIDKNTQGTPIWYDWNRYHMDRSISWFSHLQDELRKGNPEADTHLKIMPNMFSENNRSHGIDVEALTELTSFIGDDAKAAEKRFLHLTTEQEWEKHYAYMWEELSLSYDFMESVAPNKIHVNSESHFLSASWWRDLDTSVEYVENVYWLATLQGMDANMAWFWARDPDGSFEDRLEGELNFFDPALAGSFAGSVNQQPHIANAYTQVMYDLNSFSEEVIALRKQRRPVRMFYSETSAINKKTHMSQQFKMYEKLFFDGFPMGFTTQKIIEKQDNSQWDNIIVYKTEFVTTAELLALQSYLDQGGTVIIDSPQSLSKDEYGNPHKNTLKASKGKLVQLDGKQTLAQLRAVALEYAQSGLPDITLVENNGTQHKGVRWQVVKQADGSYLVSLLNLGKQTADITLALRDGKSIKVIDLFTENKLNTQLSLPSKGVKLLKVVAN